MLTNRLFNSYLWQLVAKWFSRFLGIISTVVLVRILTPDDFGLAAQSMMVIMFFQAISETGSNQFIIRMKTVSSSQLMSAWSLNLFFRTFSAGMVFVFSEQIALFVGEPRLAEVLQVSCLAPILGNFISPAVILLQKEMQFKRLSSMEIASKGASFLVTVSLALYLKSYWALIWGNITTALVTVIVSYIIAPTLPKLNVQHIKEQWQFTKGIFITSVFGYIRSKIDIFIVSSKFGTSSVGHYSVAQEFSSLPLTEVISPIMKPLFSGLAQIADDIKQLEDKAFKYLSLAYMFLIPATVGVMFLSTEIVVIVLGDKWLEAAPVLANLSLLMIVFLTNNTFKQIFILKGMFKGVIAVDILGLVLIISTLFISQITTVEVFSLFRAGIGLIVVLSTVMIVKKLLNFSVFPLVIALALPVLASAVMFVGLVLSREMVSGIGNVYIETICVVLLGALIYAVVAFGLIIKLKNRHHIWHFNYSFITHGIAKIKAKLI